MWGHLPTKPLAGLSISAALPLVTVAAHLGELELLYPKAVASAE